MSRLSAYGNVVSTAGLIGFLAVMPGAGSACAQSLNDVVRGINNVLNPNDARRLEEQAYQHGRWDEQRYWHDYRAGWNLPTAPDAITGPTAATEGDMTMGAPIVMGASMANEATVAPNLIILVTNIIVTIRVSIDCLDRSTSSAVLRRGRSRASDRAAGRLA